VQLENKAKGGCDSLESFRRACFPVGRGEKRRPKFLNGKQRKQGELKKGNRKKFGWKDLATIVSSKRRRKEAGATGGTKSVPHSRRRRKWGDSSRHSGGKGTLRPWWKVR